MNDKQLQALIKRNMAKANKGQGKGQRWKDPTIKATDPVERNDDDAQEIFREMKRREF